MAVNHSAFNLALLDALGIGRDELVTEITIVARAGEWPRVVVCRSVSDEQIGKFARLVSRYVLTEVDIPPAPPSVEQEAAKK